MMLYKQVLLYFTSQCPGHLAILAHTDIILPFSSYTLFHSVDVAYTHSVPLLKDTEAATNISLLSQHTQTYSKHT